MIELDSYNANHKQQWNDIIAKSDNGHFMFNRDFMEYHADRFQDCSFIIKYNKQIIGVIPGNLAAGNWYSHQGLTFGGLLMEPEYNRILLIDAVFKALFEKLRELKINELIYKFIPHIYHQRPCDSDLYILSKHKNKIDYYEVSSTVNLQNIGKFSELRRRGNAKANKAGLIFTLSEAWEDFWGILDERLHIKYSKNPTHTLAEIISLKNKFPENVKLYTANVEQQVCAGVVIFETNIVAHCQYISANDRGTNLHALDGLFKFLIEHYCNIGKKYFNFGISTENAGVLLNENLIQFKEGFSARSIVHCTYKLQIIEVPIHA